MPTARQKRKIRRFILGIVLLALLAAAGYRAWEWAQLRRAKAVHYPACGITIPGGYSIHGIDVSRYQYRIAWEEVKKMEVETIRMGFAFIKATEGTSFTDPQFRRNWSKAKDAGLVRGAYHFFIPSRSGAAQAEHFLKTVRCESGDFPPVLDIEQLNGTAISRLQQEALTWLKMVEEETGVRPVIYTNVDFYNRYLGETFDRYPLWVAHYYQPQQPRIKRGWLFWQHSDKGRVNGIVSPVDFNVFNGDSADFREILIP